MAEDVYTERLIKMLVINYSMLMKTLGKAEPCKKGQAAFEYLVTYGWALILIFGIIALLYAYVFKPEFYVTESCDMAPGIECGAFTLMKSGTGSDMVLTLSLMNGMDFEIEPIEVNITTKDFLDAGERTYTWRNGACSPECVANVPNAPVIGRGEMPMTFWFSLAGKEEPKPSTLQRMKFSMSYKITETDSVHRTAGIMNIRVS